VYSTYPCVFFCFSQLNESKKKLTDYVQRLEKAYAGNVKQCGEAQDKLKSVHDRLTQITASNQALREVRVQSFPWTRNTNMFHFLYLIILGQF
jgi:hypothetical protein